MSVQNAVYYILLRDRIGKKKEKGVLRTTFTKVDVLSGTLLSLVDEHDERGHLTWILETLEPENIEIECPPEDTGQIDHLRFLLLVPIPVCRERLSVFRDKLWLDEGVNLKKGDCVIVTLKGQPDLQGWIRYRGELPGVKGIQFGVELIPVHHGKGTSDGIFRKKRFFDCGMNNAVFVALHKLRRDNDPQSTNYFEQHGNKESAVGGDTMERERDRISNCRLKEGDRIVWVSDTGPEFGEVKWVGTLPDARHTDITVGVEFDNPVGSGTGKYKNHRLFHAKPMHASLVPIMGLMKAEEYLSTMTPHPSAPCITEPPNFVKKTEIAVKYQFQGDNAPVLSEKIKQPQQEESKLVQPEQHNIIMTTADIHVPIIQSQPGFTKQPGEKIPVQTTANKGVNPLYEYTISQDQKACNVETESYEQAISRKSSTNARSIPPPDPDLEVGSMVEVMANPPLYGLIRWIGFLPDQKEPVKPIAGLEMDEEISAGTDGSFRKHRIFSCPPKRAFFVPLYKCRKDKRFVDSNGRGGAFGNNFGSIETPDVNGNISPPDSLDLELIRQRVCGKQRGIQGHHNSCYLDATLFAMFYFTTVFDGILYRPKRSDDLKEYEEVKQVMKEGIVNPLRRYHYVRADKVMKLRHLLDKVGSIPGMMSEEKDPEEFLNLVLNQITKADPFLHIKQDDGKDVQHSFLYQLIMEKDERLVLPTTQQLFELSFLQMKVKLQERPSCLILQMPRFGKDYKMYRRIVPSMELDITDVLENAPRECIICGDLAAFECKECYNQHGAGLNTIAFCKDCNDRSHRHKNRVNHNWQMIKIPEEYKEIHQQQKKINGQNPSIPREKMELFAVVCIQTSHYVSFVKCGKNKDAPWVFFDSMADRMGEQSGYNIPEVTLCADLSQWLSEECHPEIMKRSDDKELPQDIRRLLCDAYMCMYHSPEVSMFK